MNWNYTNRTKSKPECQLQEEVQKLFGTYIFEVPEGCQIFTNQETFPTVSHFYSLKSMTSNFSIDLDNIELDEFQEIRNEINK